jgi:hypothetical protein
VHSAANCPRAFLSWPLLTKIVNFSIIQQQFGYLAT